MLLPAVCVSRAEVHPTNASWELESCYCSGSRREAPTCVTGTQLSGLYGTAGFFEEGGMMLTNWQVFFIAFPLWVFAVTLIVFLFLILQALRKYGDEIKKSLEDLQVDIKQITSSAATEVPEILRNASETSEEVKQITSNLKQFSAVLPYVVRPNWTTLL